MKKRIFRICIALGMLYSAFGCGKERSVAPDGDRQINEWIESVMRREYFFYSDIPDKSKLKYDDDPEMFFYSLLSDREQEGRGYLISKIGTITPETKSVRNENNSYGFDFRLYGAKLSTTEGDKLVYIARVLYVLKDSPAQEAGLRRGDFIMTVDGKPIDRDDYTNLFSGGKCLFRLGRYDESSGRIRQTGTAELPASRAVDNDPVFLTKVYETRSGKVGYLVYNHFSVNSSARYEAAYDESLRNGFARLKAENIDKLILDLRYNTGGAFSTCVLLASMLAPEDCFGRVFCRKVYNDRQATPEIEYLFSADLIGNGANLDVSDLYVLTGDHTASASETIIDCLRPYMHVEVIGKTTQGMNVGSSYYASDRSGYYIRPVTFTVYNARMESDYAGGIVPDYPVDDAFVDTKELGDPEELLLKTALQSIDGQIPAQARKVLSSGRIFETGITSLSSSCFCNPE